MSDEDNEYEGSESLPERKKLLLEEGLYRPFDLMGDWSYVQGFLVGPPLQFDTYCIHCKQQSTFREVRSPSGSGSGMSVPENKIYLGQRIFSLTFKCQRDTKHSYMYFLQVYREAIQKIGQTPSMADIASAEIERFRSVIDQVYLRELKTAIGLFSHGVGIGSFVYLRRIFEKLISDERDAARREGETLEGFEGLRLEDKIAALKNRLPPALVRHKSAYGVLSAGIHELKEETCLRYFPVLRAVIELTLEDHLSQKMKKDAATALDRELQKANQEVANAQSGTRREARAPRKT